MNTSRSGEGTRAVSVPRGGLMEVVDGEKDTDPRLSNRAW